MMYDKKFVVALKVNGKILRERDDTVSLPFGCEYSILVKNLHSVRSQISLELLTAIGDAVRHRSSSARIPASSWSASSKMATWTPVTGSSSSNANS